MADSTINIVIGGEAGQGLLTVGQILVKCIAKSGYSILVTQDSQSRIRGGHNTFTIRMGTQKVVAPKEAVDILLALNKETVGLHKSDISSRGFIIVDEGWGVDENICLKVPFGKWGADGSMNICALGVVTALLGLDRKLVLETMNRFFGSLDEQRLQENRAMLELAFSWAQEQSISFEEPTPSSYALNHLVMNGNDAIALGALTSGLKFYSFYPMTPATPIGVTLAGKAEETGVIVEQAEDEIAAINMAIGASFAGGPSMVGTSGGGFALMVEGVSLAAMTETPIVIVMAQRPGPATGLPTRTEQGDLEFVLHAGHGEFPRAVFAPGTIDECFHLTRRAFDLAERFQSPVFILTDHFLSDSFRDTPPFDLSSLLPVTPGSDTEAQSSPYRRFAFTENGVSPRLLPGSSKHLVVADSDEHTEEGHITEDLTIRKRMVDKRLRKQDGLIHEVLPPDVQGDKRPDLMLVSWGSTRGAVEEVASHLRSEGERIKTLHFSQLWPLVPDKVLDHFESARDVVCVEGNATGQMARLIRRETGFHIEKRVLRYDGLPITPEYILRGLSVTGK
ncbi:MAG: 2-oxoacid:acceptor oxidoreductase subunit alpha [Thermodesulfobacteriota bacterium]|nr:2-oxoacid:acceptor oxidoreductase subunit alpha [Thermodesulfobacteriota bacterium]